MSINTDKVLKPIRFVSKEGMDFSSTLNKRVRAYFKENNISKYANANMVIKTIFMTLLYLVPLAILLTGQVENIWIILGMFVIMGFGMAGCGLSIMHDANHGAYSKNDNVNKWIGRIINLIGGYALNWKIEHNLLHHSYTNVHEYDEDIETVKFLRFSPEEKRRPIHKYQFLYAWFFYGFMTVMWMTSKDFQQIKRYKDKDLLKSGWLIGEKTVAKKQAMLTVKYGEGEVVLIGFRTQHRNQTDATFKLLFNTIIR